MISLQVKGLDQLQAQLVDLGAELGAKTLRAAARKAFKPVLESAISKVPVDTGALRDALKLTVSKSGGDSDMVLRVGIRIAKPKGEGGVAPGRRWHLVELGTAKMAAQPFLRPALDANAGAVLELLKEELAKGIAKAIKKRGG